MKKTKPIAETDSFIVLDSYTKIEQKNKNFQSEADLEKELIQDLQKQGYEYVPHLTSQKAMLENLQTQLEALNNITFTPDEWHRFVQEYVDKANDTLVDATRKIQDNHIYDFVFDNGVIKNIYLVDKKHIARNKLQVISQFEQEGTHANRYDVTIVVNGLPLVQIELKKRGVYIREAFNQIHRYTKESFNSENSLFKYLQIFVISNGTDSRYFANTTKRNKNSFDFTMNWARSDNTTIKDLKDFTATFLQKNTLLNILLKYSVFDVSNTLLIMRPYQIAATERILQKIQSSYQSKETNAIEKGGYIWHTTGSGKTLTSFKAAQLATKLDFIDNVFFVVDRKDLDHQTMKEYHKFCPNSVNGSNNTAALRRNIEKQDNKIIVTTIQKLNNLLKTEKDLAVYQKQVVFIFDECHRSHFGEAQKNITQKFKNYYQFGFTGTPIFTENTVTGKTTTSVFGIELHSYVITDAIADEKVLKFKVDYNDVRPKFKNIEQEQNLEKLSAAEHKKAFLHPARISEISQYIVNNYRIKTHRKTTANIGFNAMFAVSSVDAAKCYYDEITRLQKDAKRPLKIATIFSFTANEEQQAIGDVEDETFEPSAMNVSAKEFLTKAIEDYNRMFGMSYGIESKEFQNYYKDLAKRVQNREVDLLIVVGMFLTGFDAPTLNTLFVDKNLRYHGLIQAFSRTNRIYNATKAFGNIVTFRDLEQATIDAIKLFGKSKNRNIVLEKSYNEYLQGFEDVVNGKNKKGYQEIVKELQEKFPEPTDIVLESEKKAFIKLFGEYLQVENILQNYDEFNHLQEFQKIDAHDEQAIEEFKKANFLTDDDIATIRSIVVLEERTIQDYRSTYNDIRDWLRKEKQSNTLEESTLDWDDVIFEVDLLKSQEINLDYILELIFNSNKITKDKLELVEQIRRVTRASIDNRAKEDLIIDFIKNSNLDEIQEKTIIIDCFYSYAQQQQKEQASILIQEENLNQEAAKRYITASLKRGYASENGTELNSTIPKMSPLNPEYLTKKQRVFEKISEFVEKFKGVGGKL